MARAFAVLDDAVPFLTDGGERRTLEQRGTREIEAERAADRAEENATSLDGLVGVPVDQRSREATS